jgi:hypothetical protein
MKPMTPQGSCGAACSCGDVTSQPSRSTVPPLVSRVNGQPASKPHATSRAIAGPIAFRGQGESMGVHAATPATKQGAPNASLSRLPSSWTVGEFRSAVVIHFFDTARERLDFEPWCRTVLFVGEDWLRIVRQSLGTAPSSTGQLAPAVLETIYDPSGFGVRVDFLSQSGVPLRSYLYFPIRRTGQGALSGIVVRVPDRITVGVGVELVVCCWSEGQLQEAPACVCNQYCDVFPSNVPCPNRRCREPCLISRQPIDVRAASLLGNWPGWTDPTPIQQRMSGMSLWLL